LKQIFTPADTEERISAKLTKMVHTAKEQAEADLGSLNAAREKVHTTSLSLKDAVTQLHEARAEALDHCVVTEEDAQQDWDANLQELTEPLLADSAKVQAALIKVKAATDALRQTCDDVKSACDHRAGLAEVLVQGLDEPAQTRLASAVEEASQPIDLDVLLRTWSLSQAEVSDALRDLEALVAEADQDPMKLGGAPREERIAQCRSEMAAAAVAVVEATPWLRHIV